jgi:hypothetical protein
MKRNHTHLLDRLTAASSSKSGRSLLSNLHRARRRLPAAGAGLLALMMVLSASGPSTALAQAQEAYEDKDERGNPILKNDFRLRKILPTPLYLGPLRRLLEPQFQMQAYDSPGVVDSERERLSFEYRRLSPESIFLRVAGILAFTRNRLGSEEPWNGLGRNPSSYEYERNLKFWFWGCHACDKSGNRPTQGRAYRRL